jgi:hypothetical protein
MNLGIHFPGRAGVQGFRLACWLIVEGDRYDRDLTVLFSKRQGPSIRREGKEITQRDIAKAFPVALKNPCALWT